MNWRKSRWSIACGECVEVGQGEAVIRVRDTAYRSGPALTVSAAAWQVFTGRVKRAGLPAARLA